MIAAGAEWSGAPHRPPVAATAEWRCAGSLELELPPLALPRGRRAIAHVAVGAVASDNAFYQREGATVAVLPSGKTRDANPYVDVSIATGIGLSRNSIVAHGDAAIGLGGGAGTLSEMAYAWQFNRLVIGMCVEGWSGKLAGYRIDERVRFPGIDDDVCFAASTADEAIAILDARLDSYLARLPAAQWT